MNFERSVSVAKILYLIKCTVCQKRIKENDNFTVWEKEHYCEPCFDEYLDVINPADFLTSLQKKKDYDQVNEGDEETEYQFGLTDELYTKFEALQKKHADGWESEERKEQHSLNNIERVEYKSSEDLFYVYYKETDKFSSVWYHYDINSNSWW